MSAYNNQFFQIVRGIDPELAEDLDRRLPEIHAVNDLNTFFHQLLAQYQQCTLELRTKLVATVDLTAWWVSFAQYILPFLLEHRLPPYTHLHATPIYDGKSCNL